MRDLAHKTYQNSPSGKITIPRSVARILAGLVIVLVFLFLIRNIIDRGGVGGSSIAVADASKGLTPVSVPNLGDIDEDALDLSIQSASFTLVNGDRGTATATRRFGDGSYSLVVNATLPDPEGNFYQVWIVGGSEQHRAGDMAGSGTNWRLEFNDVDNYSDMNQVWITREITNYDYQPELRILEGTF